MNDQDFGQIKTALQRTREERALRLEAAKTMVPFTIPFLADCLIGMGQQEVFLVGGRSGHGKTELALAMAQAMTKENRKVCFIALEAGEHEIERRNKYKALAQKFYADKKPSYVGDVPNYMEWKYGRQEALLGKYDDGEGESYLENLFIRYRDRSYTIEDLRRDMTSMKNKVDVMVVDHLHYFDYDSPNENKALGEIVKQIRDLAFDFRKPIILVGHIRKKDRNHSPIVPDMEEFHGTSDIYKNATKIVTIAPHVPELVPGEMIKPAQKYQRLTLMRAAKVRDDGSRAHYLGLMTFDVRTNTYGKYIVGTLSPDGQKFLKCTPDEIPDWAKNCSNPRMSAAPAAAPSESFQKIIPNLAPKFTPYNDD